MTIFWFRRDLRLHDNHGLYEALSGDDEILPIFIFDSNILAELPKNDARVTLIHSLLDRMQQQLKALGKSMAVFHDEPEKVFAKLIKENDIKAVYTNHDYEPYARKRDKAIKQLLNDNNIDFHTFKDHVIFECDEVVKDDGTLYVVYTPYMKKWKETMLKRPFKQFPSQDMVSKIASHAYPFLSLEDIGFTESTIKAKPFDVSGNILDNYSDRRDFPAIHGTSRLGPYLRFGSISIREAVKAANSAKEETFLNELIWREFFMQILWHFPQTVNNSFRPTYDTIKWRNNESEFRAWCEGRTGYPIVDAGMRELNATGYMHNRVRMVVASFLCKHLLIDWRWGEAYFALKLLDYEQASNVGNWQWAAGSGVDAAPYFRIFNPEEQVKKFDKEFKYIKKWVPEFQELDYQPVVDHKEARERALMVYKEAVK